VKRLFVFSVFLFTVIFSYTVIIEDLLLLRKCADISFTEIIQGLLDDDVNKPVHHKFQKAENISSLYMVNSSSPTGIFSYQPETAGHIQPQKTILRI
jgi:hypothetical protein